MIRRLSAAAARADISSAESRGRVCPAGLWKMALASYPTPVDPQGHRAGGRGAVISPDSGSSSARNATNSRGNQPGVETLDTLQTLPSQYASI